MERRTHASEDLASCQVAWSSMRSIASPGERLELRVFGLGVAVILAAGAFSTTAENPSEP